MICLYSYRCVNFPRLGQERIKNTLQFIIIFQNYFCYENVIDKFWIYMAEEALQKPNMRQGISNMRVFQLTFLFIIK